MAKDNKAVLTEEFLMDLYCTCLENDYILGIVTEHIKKEYLPDKDFIGLHSALSSYYKEHRHRPDRGIIGQIVSSKRGVSNLLQEITDYGSVLNPSEAVRQIENYIRQVRFQAMYRESGELYNNRGFDEAVKKVSDFAEWNAGFCLLSPEYLDIIATFGSRYDENKLNHDTQSSSRPITRFYINELDEMNQQQNLRTQLTCILAPTGVGKSHAARWIGRNACVIDGFNVLHFQLEGSKEEVANAYSASLVSCNTYRYTIGRIHDLEMQRMLEKLKCVSGKLFVKSYPKFNAHVSTIDIRNGIQEFSRQYGITPDIVIIDSMDLLTDSSGRKWGENAERHKRIAVANDLKDLAADENVWMVVTYQSTIENRDWLNDEKNVLTEYNTAEAKGISRPLTHLISLNQSDRERKEHTMRIHVAKSRFFEKGETIRIATNFENEMFYDAERTLNLSKVE